MDREGLTFFHVKTQQPLTLFSYWEGEDKFKKTSIFRVAFRKCIMFGKSFALVFLEMLQLFTKNELEVNETK